MTAQHILVSQATRRIGAAVVMLAALAACAIFFGNYALDDSFVGYANAQNLARGLGFTFNPGDRLLTTSGPLVVPLYAAGAMLHFDIVTLAQIVSALALIACAMLSYRLALRLGSVFGAFCTAFVLITSPLVILLWSHETLVWLALTLGALELGLSRRLLWSAVVLGLSALARPEAVFAAPFLLFWVYRNEGKSAALRYALLSAVPFALWSAYALPAFGTIFSQSIAAKHAQLLYGGVPYLTGLVLHYVFLYADSTSRAAAALLLVSLAVGLLVALGSQRTRVPAIALAAWFALLSAFYIAAQVHFFDWFGVQAAVLTAFAAGAPWVAAMTPFARLGRLCALCIVAVNALFVVSLWHNASLKYSIDGMLVLPHIEDNNYYRLARYLRAHTQPDDTIAYPEIGQLRYYGDRGIVDFDGLATPGVAKAMESGDTIWAFERYQPTVFIDAQRHWANIVDPPEYDWFAHAYARDETVVLPYEPGKDHFTIYRLVDPTDIPPPETLVRGARVEVAADGLHFVAAPPGPITALEVRLDSRRCPNAQIVITPLSGPPRFSTIGTHERDVVRVRVAIDPGSRGPYAGRLEGCTPGALAPPLLPRFGFMLFDRPRVRGVPADAISLYEQPPG